LPDLVDNNFCVSVIKLVDATQREQWTEIYGQSHRQLAALENEHSHFIEVYETPSQWDIAHSDS